MKTLKNIVSKDKYRPILNGVYFENNGDMVATNAHIMVVLKGKNTDSSLFGRVVSIKTGLEIEGEYPNYLNVVPANNPFVFQMDIDVLFDFAKNSWDNTGKENQNRFKKSGSANELCCFKLLDIDFYFAPLCLFHVLKCLKDNGAKTVNVAMDEPNKAIAITDVISGNLGLVMPIRCNSFNNVFNFQMEVTGEQIELAIEIIKSTPTWEQNYYKEYLASGDDWRVNCANERIIASIEKRDEQIERLRRAMK
jgi:hypothetical protein